MRIEDKRTVIKVTFGEIVAGDCFIYEDELYIKIAESTSATNAFNLERNKKEGFSTDVIVISVNAKAVIE